MGVKAIHHPQGIQSVVCNGGFFGQLFHGGVLFCANHLDLRRFCALEILPGHPIKTENAGDIVPIVGNFTQVILPRTTKNICQALSLIKNDRETDRSWSISSVRLISYTEIGRHSVDRDFAPLSNVQPQLFPGEAGGRCTPCQSGGSNGKARLTHLVDDHRTLAKRFETPRLWKSEFDTQFGMIKGVLADHTDLP